MRTPLQFFQVTLIMATVGLLLPDSAGGQGRQFQVTAIRYATIESFPVSGLVRGADRSERMDIAMVVWLIRGEGRNVLFDTGFHRPEWFDRFNITDYLSPDEAVRLTGVDPDSVTDVIVSHAHWDHMGGIDLFPNADIWIQRDEFTHYTATAWQDGGNGGGADPGDLLELVRRNTSGQVKLVNGDGVEILPGIRVYTGARHTYASQYITVDAEPRVLLASDNAYLYRNLRDHRPVATFNPQDSIANLAAITRMIDLAGGMDNVIPGHDPEQFTRFPGTGRVVRIRP